MFAVTASTTRPTVARARATTAKKSSAKVVKPAAAVLRADKVRARAMRCDAMRCDGSRGDDNTPSRGARGVADASRAIAARSRAVRMRGKLAHGVDAREGGAGRRAMARCARAMTRVGFRDREPKIARARSGRRRAIAHWRIAHRARTMDVDDMCACVRAVCDGFARARWRGGGDRGRGIVSRLWSG